MIYLILTPFILFFLWFFGNIIKDSLVFKYDPHNPFRRNCKKCGQQQTQYTRSYNHNVIWWEEVYPLLAKDDCQCKKYASEEKW